MRHWIPSPQTKTSERPAFNSWPRPLRDVFRARGFESDESLQIFLEPNLQNLKDPFTLLGMEPACLRLEKAFRLQEKVCIYADFDLDGTSGCALLKKAFEQLGFQNLIAFQPKRLKDGYGFHAPIVEELKKQDVQLIVTCDVGITANKACEKALELGVDVIITDHHLSTGQLPKAMTIVNPNQPEDTSGLGYLSGAGVAFYLVRALKRHFTNLKLGTYDQLNLKELLDCFTIATITDMVPLIEDNRILTKIGLQVLSQTTRPGLEALMQQLGLFGKKLTSADVSIRFAPKLNALSRLEGAILPLDLYLENDPHQALQAVKFVLSQNEERASLQSEALKIAESIAASQADHACHFIVSENFHRGVIGLIATTLAEQTQKPCFVASLDTEEKKIVGSCRKPESTESSLVEALETASPHLLRFGGHAAAAGFETDVSKIPFVQEALNAFFSSHQKTTKAIRFDTDVQWHELNWELIEKMESLEPFGVGFESPTFFLKSCEVKSYKTLKGRHLKLELVSREGSQVLQALLFNPSRRQTELVKKNKWIEALVQIQVNEWRGQRQIQLMLEDVRSADQVSPTQDLSEALL